MSVADQRLAAGVLHLIKQRVDLLVVVVAPVDAGRACRVGGQERDTLVVGIVVVGIPPVAHQIGALAGRLSTIVDGVEGSTVVPWLMVTRTEGFFLSAS